MTANFPLSNSDSLVNPVAAPTAAPKPQLKPRIEVPYEDAFCWRKVDSLKFIMQIVLTLAVMGLCVGKLTAPNASAEDKALYWGGVTGILAWWMPSPGRPTPTKGNQQPDNPDQPN